MYLDLCLTSLGESSLKKWEHLGKIPKGGRFEEKYIEAMVQVIEIMLHGIESML